MTIYKKGSTGSVVGQIQQLVGANRDGIFGSETEKLVMAYQNKRGLIPDGEVGPATYAVMFPSAPKPSVPITSTSVVRAQNQPLADMARKLGKAFIGVIYEPTGANDGTGVKFLQSWMEGDQTATGYMKGQPWCATFTSFLLWLAGKALDMPVAMKKTASSSELYEFAEDNGLLISTPIPGCIALEKGDGGSPGKSHHHTCLVDSVNANGTFVSLDGNESNKVGMFTHTTSGFDFVLTC